MARAAPPVISRSAAVSTLIPAQSGRKAGCHASSVAGGPLLAARAGTVATGAARRSTGRISMSAIGSARTRGAERIARPLNSSPSKVTMAITSSDATKAAPAIGSGFG